MPAEQVGTVPSALIGGAVVDESVQEKFGLVTIVAHHPPTRHAVAGSGCLLRPGWVVTAAHVVDSAAAPNDVEVRASWGWGALTGTSQSRRVKAVHAFPPFDVALLELARPLHTRSFQDASQTRLINQDGQFPFWGTEVGMPIMVFGRGISDYAVPPSTPAVSDGRYRVGYANVSGSDEVSYRFDSSTGTDIVGGDSGGPSFAWTLNGYVLVGVHIGAEARYLDGKPHEWEWVIDVQAAHDAPLRPLLDRLTAVMGPSPIPPQAPPHGFIGTFAGTPPITADEVAISTVRSRASRAAGSGYAVGIPNFFEARRGPDVVSGTFFIRPDAVRWAAPTMPEIDVRRPADFGHRIRAAATYASNQKMAAGWPTLLDTDYGDGLRSAIFLLEPEVAETRNVSLFDLGLQEQDLADIGRRFRAVSTYATANGYAGGYPNMFHERVTHLDARKGRRVTEVVCGVVLLKAPYAVWDDVVVFAGPR